MEINRANRIVLGLLLIVLPCLGYAQQPQHEAVLLGFLNHLHSMSAAFDQMVSLKQVSGDSTGIVQRTHGQMALMRPGQFRWAVSAPDQRLIVMNHGQLWVYDPDLMQVMHRSMDSLSQQGATPAALLSGSAAVFMQQFRLEKAFFDKDVGWWFTLTPRSQSNSLSSLKLHFVQAELADMQFTDRLGRENQLHFTHRLINASLDHGLFQFNPPKGVDVVEGA